MLVFVFAPALSTATDVECPPPEPVRDFAVQEAPKDIFSVDVDDENEYSFLIDLNFRSYSLDAVVLSHMSGDKILLLTSVKPLRLDTQAAVNIIVDASISEDVRLLWTYTEPDKVCPETVRFEYRFNEDGVN